MENDNAHLIVRKDHVLCTICGCIEPVHPGDGTPLPTFVIALMLLVGRHPQTKHADPHKDKK